MQAVTGDERPILRTNQIPTQRQSVEQLRVELQNVLIFPMPLGIVRRRLRGQVVPELRP